MLLSETQGNPEKQKSTVTNGPVNKSVKPVHIYYWINKKTKHRIAKILPQKRNLYTYSGFRSTTSQDVYVLSYMQQQPV